MAAYSIRTDKTDYRKMKHYKVLGYWSQLCAGKLVLFAIASAKLLANESSEATETAASKSSVLSVLRRKYLF